MGTTSTRCCGMPTSAGLPLICVEMGKYTSAVRSTKGFAKINTHLRKLRVVFRVALPLLFTVRGIYAGIGSWEGRKNSFASRT